MRVYFQASCYVIGRRSFANLSSLRLSHESHVSAGFKACASEQGGQEGLAFRWYAQMPGSLASGSIQSTCFSSSHPLVRFKLRNFRAFGAVGFHVYIFRHPAVFRA